VIDDANGIYAYRCAAGQHTAVIALNVSAEKQIVHLPEHASYRLALTSDSTSELHEATCVLAPCAGVLLWEYPPSEG
jgi:hypothetical protein